MSEKASSLPQNEETTERFINILKDNGITDKVSEVTVKDAGLKGEGFLSETYCVTVKFENASLKPLNLFVKTQTLNPAHSSFLEEGKVFVKEATFFMKYIPALRAFCQSKGQESLLEIYPKCYFADESITVLENIVLEKGFTMLERTKPQEFEEASLALGTLATHHALSYALLQELGTGEEFFKRFPSLDHDLFKTDAIKQMLGSLENAVQSNIKILEKSNVEGKEEAIEMMKAKPGKLWDLLMDKIKNHSDDKILLLNHGDYQNNNMMFIIDNVSKRPVKHIALDFQASRYASPALDICSFLYSSVNPEVRRGRLRELLTIYLNTFNSTTEKLGHPTNLAYEEFFHMYCKKVSFGVWTIGMMLVSSASMIVIKEIDITKIDFRDFGKIFLELIQKWTEKNPEACENDAAKMVELAKEYKELVLDKGLE